MASTQSSNPQYLPWSWAITSADTSTVHCPTSTETLLTFAAVNAIVGAVSTAVSHRAVVRKLTCGRLGNQESRSWTWAWIFPLALQIAAAFAVAHLIKTAPKHISANVPLHELALLLLTRPRLSFFFCTLAVLCSRDKQSTERSVAELARRQREEPEARLGLSGSLMKRLIRMRRLIRKLPDQARAAIRTEPTIFDEGDVPLKHSGWGQAVISNLLAETILTVLSMYTMGRTVRFASANGFYPGGAHYHSVPAWPRLMNGGALVFLIMGCMLTFAEGFFILLGASNKRFIGIIEPCVFDMVLVCTGFMCYSWWTNWLFWAGFVNVAGERYCTPNLIAQGAIWTLFTSIGAFLGGGM